MTTITRLSALLLITGTLAAFGQQTPQQLADSELPSLLTIYKDLHIHPELSTFEERSSGIVATGDFKAIPHCPPQLLPGQSCSIGVTFTPQAAGARCNPVARFGEPDAQGGRQGGPIRGRRKDDARPLALQQGGQGRRRAEPQ